jgi:hypothetical protein
MNRCMVVTVSLLIAGGCATSFTGSAQIEGGRPGCERKCASAGLQMQAFVFMGEYSTACVCEAARRPEQAGAAAASAAIGVMQQMRAAQDEFCARDDCSRFSD